MSWFGRASYSPTRNFVHVGNNKSERVVIPTCGSITLSGWSTRDGTKALGGFDYSVSAHGVTYILRDNTLAINNGGKVTQLIRTTVWVAVTDSKSISHQTGCAEVLRIKTKRKGRIAFVRCHVYGTGRVVTSWEEVRTGLLVQEN